MAGKGRALLLLAALLLGLAAQASAQMAPEAPIGIYAAPGALRDGQAKQLVQLLEEAFPEADWALLELGESLRQQVMADRAPDIAICAPGEAMPWAREGLLLPLEGCVAGAGRLAPQALSAGVWQETLCVAPLIARHRQVAVNLDRLEQLQMRHLMDSAAYPVWQPTQLERVLEECWLSGEIGMEVWLPKEGEGDAVSAFVQALYGGTWIAEESGARTGEMMTVLGAEWLSDMVKSGVIALAESREEALEHFLGGKTVLFIDWTDKEERIRLRRTEDQAFALTVMPYPSEAGVPVRSFELTGICAFARRGDARGALLRKAIAFLHTDEAAQALLGSRGIWRDGAIWLADEAADDRSVMLHRLTQEAICAVLEEKAKAKTAFAAVSAAMDAAGYREAGQNGQR